MKDIKLTIEEIKKGCEYTQDFICYHSNSIFMIQYMKGSFNPKFSEGDTETATLWKDTYYPLFLQRVIEGINDSGYEIEIEQKWESVTVSGQAIEDQDFQFYLFSNKDQAKTQAIKYILDKLK